MAPKLTETAIHNCTGEQSLAQGRPYFRDGSILNPRRQGDVLKAQWLDQENPWRTLIANLRQEHKSLPALKDELNKAKL
jgi:hypothetical protein